MMSCSIVRKISFLIVATLAVLAMVGGCSSEDHSNVGSDSTKSMNMADYVKIGGIDQWITITGTDSRNPVILFLHGGPGNAMSPFAALYFAGWEKEFTLVQWDQRGAGRTYGRSGESVGPTMTVERMTEDGIEIGEFLKKHLQKNKIILVGGSWGSILGIRMAHARPDLFYAYMGVAHATNWQQDLAASVSRLNEMAQSKGDQATLDALNALGPLPWDSAEKFISFRKVLGPYQAEVETAPMPPFGEVASEYEADFKPGGAWLEADGFSFLHFFGPTLSGPLTHVDITSLTDFKIPIFFVLGEMDLTCPPELSRAYFETIRAPLKKIYVAPGTGHNFSWAQLKLMRDVLLNQVRPIAVEK